MTLKIHFVGLAVIILLLIAIAYKSSEPAPVPVSPYKIEIVNASFGLNCNEAKPTGSVADPYADTAQKPVEKNNVLSIIAQSCNGKVTCKFTVDQKTLGADPAPQCSKKLDIDYRCFSYDRPWKASAEEFETLSIDCSTRGG